MASQNFWTWDEGRHEYYYWCESESCWIYQSGKRVYPSNTQSTSVPEVESLDVAVPRLSENFTGLNLESNSFLPSHQYTHSIHTKSNQNIAVSSENQQTQRLSSVGDGYSPGLHSEAAMNTDSLIFKTLSHRNVESGVLRRNFNTGPAEVLTEPGLLREGGRSYRKIRETPQDREQLDPLYRIRRPGSEFFVVGKVFKILWPELPRDIDDNISVSSVGRYDDAVISKIRWFVVVREGRSCCSCLPILTYATHGVAKRNVVKRDHSIVYTGAVPPQPRHNELPVGNEKGMMEPIGVKTTVHGERLDKMSRINFGKIYTVEHNVKVYDFGNVKPSCIRLFVLNFEKVWNIISDPSSRRFDKAMKPNIEDEDEHEDDYEDEYGEDYEDEGEEDYEDEDNEEAHERKDDSDYFMNTGGYEYTGWSRWHE